MLIILCSSYVFLACIMPQPSHFDFYITQWKSTAWLEICRWGWLWLFTSLQLLADTVNIFWFGTHSFSFRNIVHLLFFSIVAIPASITTIWSTGKKQKIWPMVVLWVRWSCMRLFCLQCPIISSCSSHSSLQIIEPLLRLFLPRRQPCTPRSRYDYFLKNQVWAERAPRGKPPLWCWVNGPSLHATIYFWWHHLWEW